MGNPLHKPFPYQIGLKSFSLSMQSAYEREREEIERWNQIRRFKNRQSAKKSRLKAAERERQIVEQHRDLKAELVALEQTLRVERSNNESIIANLRDTLYIKQKYNAMLTEEKQQNFGGNPIQTTAYLLNRVERGGLSD